MHGQCTEYNTCVKLEVDRTIEFKSAYNKNVRIINYPLCTYIHVATYVCILQINTLQCVLASTTVMDSFVILLYAGGEIQWTTGDDSGGVNGLYGTEALVGINVGDGVNFTTIPGSLTPSIANITQTSNVGIPGTWMFKVHNGRYIRIYTCIYIYIYIYMDTCI